MTLVLLALFIGGLNYANNLVLGLCFLLGSLLIVSIHHTYANFSGLTITAVKADPAFAGEKASFYLRLNSSGKKRYESLRFVWADAEQMVDVVAGEVEVVFALKTDRRGYFQPPRIKVETEFPLGIFRAWTWLDLDVLGIVYPKPIESHETPNGVGAENEGKVQKVIGQEDFDGFKTYTAGDALAHVSWTHLARGQGMLTKQYSAEMAGTDFLDWSFFVGVDKETRLSRLAYWVNKLAREDRIYGLRIPGLEIPLAAGQQHRAKCLEALALFERGPR